MALGGEGIVDFDSKGVAAFPLELRQLAVANTGTGSPPRVPVLLCWEHDSLTHGQLVGDSPSNGTRGEGRLPYLPPYLLRCGGDATWWRHRPPPPLTIGCEMGQGGRVVVVYLLFWPATVSNEAHSCEPCMPLVASNRCWGWSCGGPPSCKFPGWPPS